MPYRLKKLYFVSIFLLLFQITFSQNIVIDSISREPIQSVHVKYNKTEGLVTNEDGYFVIPSNIKHDSVTLSHLGYKAKYLSNKFIANNDSISLSPVSTILDEVVLLNFRAKDTINKSIDLISSNYLFAPHNSMGYFRQSLQEDGRGIEMIEVDFTSFLESKNLPYLVRVNESKKTDNHSQITINTVGGVFSMIEKGDFVKEEKYFLNKSNIENYTFQYEGLLDRDKNKNIYKISFRPKDEKDLRYFRIGTLFIEAESLAIVEIRYFFDPNKLKSIKELQIKKLAEDGKKLRLKKPIFLIEKVENVIKYKPLENGKFVLSEIDVLSDKIGKVRKDNHTYTQIAKLVINHVETDDVVKVETNYNIDQDFSKALRKIDRKNQWNDTYKIPMSKSELKVLEDIFNN